MTKKATTKIFKTPVRASTPPRARMPAGPSQDAQKMALAAAGAGLDKKAIDVEIIDVTGKVDYADFLVLMTGQSDRHVASIAESVDSALSKVGWQAISVEGLPRGQWVLIDFVDIVVHVFSADTRTLYDIDGLWMDARRLRVPESAPGTG
ncbi:MAG: ribosome silencing factor [Pseudomonadota bacterium]